MEWVRWKPLYEQILQDFNFDEKTDMKSAEILANLVKIERIPNYSTIVDKLGGHVSICGASASLEDELDTLHVGGTIISAGSATGRMMRIGVVPDVIVTDLDGDVEFEIEANAKGALVFVHAHGDNIAEIERAVPQMVGSVVPTVQCRPFGELYNFGGFTDGDRSYFIAKHFGVHRIDFLGWDLGSPYPKPGVDPIVKSKKLTWAGRLIREI